jgi:hypothetical protein
MNGRVFNKKLEAVEPVATDRQRQKQRQQRMFEQEARTRETLRVEYEYKTRARLRNQVVFNGVAEGGGSRVYQAEAAQQPSSFPQDHMDPKPLKKTLHQSKSVPTLGGRRAHLIRAKEQEAQRVSGNLFYSNKFVDRTQRNVVPPKKPELVKQEQEISLKRSFIQPGKRPPKTGHKVVRGDTMPRAISHLHRNSKTPFRKSKYRRAAGLVRPAVMSQRIYGFNSNNPLD